MRKKGWEEIEREVKSDIEILLGGKWSEGKKERNYCRFNSVTSL